MKEVLTKSFWRGVTKTFYQALEGPPPKSTPSQTAAEKAPESKPSPEAQPSTADDGTRSRAS
jgi:hypothetical protein